MSYSRQDRSLVKPLVNLLRASGNEVFIDVEDLDYGENWKDQLDEAISRSSRFLLFWSKHSSRSDYVSAEWRTALDEKELPIVPVILDKTPLPLELVSFHGTDELQPIVNRVRFLSRAMRWIPWAIVPIMLPFFVYTTFSVEQAVGYDTINVEDIVQVLIAYGPTYLVALGLAFGYIAVDWSRRRLARSLSPANKRLGVPTLRYSLIGVLPFVILGFGAYSTLSENHEVMNLNLQVQLDRLTVGKIEFLSILTAPTYDETWVRDLNDVLATLNDANTTLVIDHSQETDTDLPNFRAGIVNAYLREVGLLRQRFVQTGDGFDRADNLQRAAVLLETVKTQFDFEPSQISSVKIESAESRLRTAIRVRDRERKRIAEEM